MTKEQVREMMRGLNQKELILPDFNAMNILLFYTHSTVYVDDLYLAYYFNRNDILEAVTAIDIEI